MKNWESGFLAIFGIFLFAIGLYALFSSDASPAWRYLGGALLCMLGVNTLHGALTGKRPWISKIGPLP